MMMILRGMGEHNKDEVQCPSASQEMDRMWSILKGGGEGAEQEQKRQELNRQLVYRVVTLQDFMVLCRCGKIIDPTFKDTKSESLASLFLRVHKKMPELLEAHARRRRRLAPRVPSRHEQGLAGRNEMEVLMSELWALKPLASKYAGPFDLIAQMLHRQLSESFLDSAIKESAARSEAASAAAPPPARRNRSKEAAERSGMRFSTATGS
ncbi:unnamed protein product [Prorocentrum cordatum]|uniref:Uncharacterized protein n=1 Tax=Prorocentrum cordatum TaxID=2364126 RepID=A0ABN9WN01_9DINO|nr:unnamed protein product [Polarella glacialis]